LTRRLFLGNLPFLVKGGTLVQRQLINADDSVLIIF